MNIGIIVYSQTGHTLFVAKRLQEQYLQAGHMCSIEQVTAANNQGQRADSISLTSAPKIEGYDLLVFGSPVHGGMVTPVMQAYLRQLPSLSGKTVLAFVTHFFPFQGMGGRQSIEGLASICRSKGGEAAKTGIISWSIPSKRERLIEETLDKFQIG